MICRNIQHLIAPECFNNAGPTSYSCDGGVKPDLLLVRTNTSSVPTIGRAVLPAAGTFVGANFIPHLLTTFVEQVRAMAPSKAARWKKDSRKV
jgi:hypothetical protein